MERTLAVPEAKIVALCDTNPEATKRFHTRYPKLATVPDFTDWQKMLSSVKADAVSINTPHTLHFEQIMGALDRGLHVITEKPMVCTTAHAHALVQKVKETGLKLQVSYQWVFDNRFRRAKQIVEDGELGEVLAFSANLSQEWKNQQKGTWRQDPALSGGGQLNDSGSHLVNIVLWITGLEAAKVAAFVDHRGTPVDINSALSIRCTNGAQGTINILGECSQWWDDWVIWGAKGMLVYHEGVLKHLVNGAEKEKLKHEPEQSDPDRNFIEAILGKSELACPVERGLRVIELTEAAWESARTGAIAIVK